MIDLYSYLEICVVNLLKPDRINTDSINYFRSNPLGPTHQISSNPFTLGPVDPTRSTDRHDSLLNGRKI